MPQIEEFSFIAAQLEWLEGYLRKLPASQESSRLEGAVNALSCARAVMVELDHIGNSEPATRVAAG